MKVIGSSIKTINRQSKQYSTDTHHRQQNSGITHYGYPMSVALQTKSKQFLRNTEFTLHSLHPQKFTICCHRLRPKGWKHQKFMKYH